MIKYILSVLAMFAVLCSELFPQSEVPEEYIRMAFDNNLALQQEEFSYKQSVAALDEARSWFLPKIDISARYSLAGGGREIDIPIGDLINPMHSALNLLMQTQVFPANLPNESIPFLREKEQETKLRVTQPLFRPVIYYNYRLNKKKTKIQMEAREQYARQLLADVKTAYYNYLSAVDAVDIYNSYKKVLEENLRISESLVKNGKATRDIIFNAEAELANMEKNISGAIASSKAAAYYFNFLLNRDLDSEIVTDISPSGKLATGSVEKYINSALENREELKQLSLAVEAMDDRANIHKSSYFPNLNFAFDYGFQGEEYKFNSENDFWMASFVLNWNLFSGFGDEAKVKAARFAKQENSAKLEEVKKLVTLEVRRAVDNLSTAEKSVVAARKTSEASGKSFNIVSKRYAEGMTGFIEYIDAFNRVTRADINLNIEKNKLYKSYAELEKVSALVNIKKFTNKRNED